MGSDAHVLLAGDQAAMDAAVAMVCDLEQRWSRFLPDSEVSAMNASGGMDVVVSPETLLLVARSIQAWELTDGAFDPTVYDAMVAAGYDRTFDQVAGSPAPASPSVVPGVAGIELQAQRSSVRLPRGVRLDPGGIGKGLAADLIVDSMAARGVTSGCVNLGGDLRVLGAAPDGGLWRIGIDHPVTGEQLAEIGMEAGAVATSSPLKRRWQRGAEPVHHLIDPATGRSAVTSVAAATVFAGEGWRAEAFAKAAVLSGSVRGALARISAASLSGVVLDLAGRLHATRDLARRVT
jgi:thiamine biosynthesis lipoprotein